ncbi:MAG: SAM-dependent chlorinase/fluorinase [Candidatus Omnitrophica bacterium]|nr:SAM-dependent chlorinase/fluorinase [Candidatus Omnitrophota bacterium]MCM8827178.1 SAM-dependent chlorinase/fluorinase [Candidatus Omnitrophota bacterium]
MRVIGLLTDFGYKDNYVGVMKAVILNINPKVNIVDITHSVTSHSVSEGAFLLWKSYRFFPKDSIFLVVVDPGVGSQRRAIAVKTKNYYFVGPDNGVLYLAVKEDSLKKIVSLDNKNYFLKYVSSTFHGRDVFSSIVGYISKGVDIEILGKKNSDMESLEISKPLISKDRIKGEIIYIDNFGNIVTNITKDDFLSVFKNKKFIASLNGRNFSEIYDCYNYAPKRKPFFIEGSFSYLEVSLKESSASKYFKARIGNQVEIKLSNVG